VQTVELFPLIRIPQGNIVPGRSIPVADAPWDVLARVRREPPAYQLLFVALARCPVGVLARLDEARALSLTRARIERVDDATATVRRVPPARGLGAAGRALLEAAGAAPRDGFDSDEAFVDAAAAALADGDVAATSTVLAASSLDARARAIAQALAPPPPAVGRFAAALEAVLDGRAPADPDPLFRMLDRVPLLQGAGEELLDLAIRQAQAGAAQELRFWDAVLVRLDQDASLAGLRDRIERRRAVLRRSLR
jgi:hypothetical protein